MSIDSTKYNVAKQAFKTCETDGVDGLTWQEVEECEDTFCGLLSIECPTQADFDAMDGNSDGILTFVEMMQANFDSVDRFDF